MAVFVTRLLLLCAFATLLLVRGENNCDHGPQCANYNNCEIGLVYYCCPDGSMSLKWDYGKVTSCSCGSGSGVTCSGTGGQGNSGGRTSASGLTCALTSAVAIVLASRWVLQE